MAEFPISYDITASWEGKWSKVPAKNPSEYKEESAYGQWWGTNFGLTGTYMKEFAGWEANRKTEFQQMNKAQCGEIWKRTRWTWGRFSEINDQEIANLLFDWGVRRWNSLTIKPMSSNPKQNRSGLGEALGFKAPLFGQLFQNVKNINIGGKVTDKGAGFYVFTDTAIQLINNHRNPALLYSILKSKRAELDKVKGEEPSIQYRYASFAYTGTSTKEVFMSSANAKKRSLVIQDRQKQKTGILTDSILTDIILVGIGGKMAKIW